MAYSLSQDLHVNTTQGKIFPRWILLGSTGFQTGDLDLCDLDKPYNLLEHPLLLQVPGFHEHCYQQSTFSTVCGRW